MVNGLKRKKITKEVIEKMRELKSKGYSYTQISFKLRVNTQTILYHLNEKYREKRKKSSRKIMKKRYKKLRGDENRKEYARNYCRKRYKNDVEFREKQKKRCLDYFRKKQKEKK